jgi:hypothetical protein
MFAMLVARRAWWRALAALLFALAVVVAQATPAGAPRVTEGATLRQLAGWTTSFTPSDHNGWGANIWIPARTLDGYVVAPGARFDFWTAVGPITRARGYRIGGAIVGGHTQEGVALGGGICAASSTLFNAAYRAGFPINARSAHYYYITRYPIGLDATVSTSQHMAWTNDTRYPVLIRGITGATSVRFELWSRPTGRSVTISRPVIANYGNAHTHYVRTSALPDGTRRLIEYTIDGFSAAVTRTVRDGNGASSGARRRVPRTTASTGRSWSVTTARPTSRSRRTRRADGARAAGAALSEWVAPSSRESPRGSPRPSAGMRVALPFVRPARTAASRAASPGPRPRGRRRFRSDRRGRPPRPVPRPRPGRRGSCPPR